MFEDVFMNEYGFYTLKTLPSDEEREAYYKEKYYQYAMSSYDFSYTKEELHFFNVKLEQKFLLIEQYATSLFCSQDNNHSYIDIGCGEGFAVKFFKNKGFSVLGLDYSIAGVDRHNPDIKNNIIIGDIYDSIDRLVSNASQFDIVNMDNVLEHVINPRKLLEQVFALIKSDGIVVIKVPNDFSYLHEYFLQNEIVKKAHWVAPIDHISYFNKEGLLKICDVAGLECLDILGNYFTEFFILNPNTNYYLDVNVGKSCHNARVAMENILHTISPEKTIDLSRVLGSMGLGREIIGIFKKKVY